MLNESNPRAVKIFQQDREYFQIGVSIDCVILGYEKGKLKVLLIECKLKEYEGLWSLLGDILQPEEDIDEASYRILRDRTGLDDVFLEQVQTFGSVKRHPGGRVITVGYYSLINIRDHQLQLSDNFLHWHLVNEVKEMAFDHKKSYLWILTLGTIVNLGANVLLAKLWEAPGTVVAIIITEIFITIGLNRELYKNNLTEYIKLRTI